MEEWKSVIGYEGLYEVSNIGRVRSLDKILVGRMGSIYTRRGCVSKEHIDSFGYSTKTVSKDKDVKVLKVHRMVAEAFLPNPNNLKCVNHLNGIKSDNRVENLEWCTYSENTIHAYATGLKMATRMPYENYTKNSGCIQIDINGNIVDTFISRRYASRATGIPHQNISYAINGKYNKAGGYFWKDAE